MSWWSRSHLPRCHVAGVDGVGRPSRQRLVRHVQRGGAAHFRHPPRTRSQPTRCTPSQYTHRSRTHHRPPRTVCGTYRFAPTPTSAGPLTLSICMTSHHNTPRRPPISPRCCAPLGRSGIRHTVSTRPQTRSTPRWRRPRRVRGWFRASSTIRIHSARGRHSTSTHLPLKPPLAATCPPPSPPLVAIQPIRTPPHLSLATWQHSVVTPFSIGATWGAPPHRPPLGSTWQVLEPTSPRQRQPSRPRPRLGAPVLGHPAPDHRRLLPRVMGSPVGRHPPIRRQSTHPPILLPYAPHGLEPHPSTRQASERPRKTAYASRGRLS